MTDLESALQKIQIIFKKSLIFPLKLIFSPAWPVKLPFYQNIDL